MSSSVPCVDSERLIQHVFRWLHDAPIANDVAIDVEGSQEPPSFVEFTLRRGGTLQARRRFEPVTEDCQVLESTLSLSIALALKASLIVELSESEPPHEASSSGWALAARLGAGARVTAGAHVAADVVAIRRLSPHAALRFGVTGLRSQRALLGPEREGVSTGVLALASEGCGTTSWRADSQLRGCLGARVGVLHARGESFAVQQTANSFWASATASLGLTVQLYGRWWLDLSTDLLVTLTPTRLEARTQAGTVVATRALPALGGELAFGPLLQF